MYNTSTSTHHWDVAVARSRLLLQKEQSFQRDMAAMRRRLNYIAKHQDELPESDLDEAAELQTQLQTVGLEYANWMQANLGALEAASKCGIRL